MLLLLLLLARVPTAPLQPALSLAGRGDRRATGHRWLLLHFLWHELCSQAVIRFVSPWLLRFSLAGEQ